MTERTRQRKRQDRYYREAKTSGYRSRSSFKLIQIDAKWRIIRTGDIVVDLGAAPGGWLQVTAERVGASGFVLGVDLDPIVPLGTANVRTIQGDLTSPTVLARVAEILPRRADVLLSDAAPHVSGNWILDQARQLYLAQKSLEACKEILRLGGHVIIKVFQGSDYENLLKQARSAFRQVSVNKPPASRGSSSEVYLVCRGFLGGESLV